MTKMKMKMMKSGFLIAIMSAVFLMNGCASHIEPQNRNYIMCLGIDQNNDSDSYCFSFGFPDLGALGGDGEQAVSPVRNMTAATLTDAVTSLNASSDKRTDFSQLAVIIIGKTLWEDDEAFHAVLQQLAACQSIKRTALLAVASDTAETILQMDDKVDGSVGVYIYEMGQNNFEDQGIRLCVLEDYVGGRNRDERMLPILTVQDDQLLMQTPYEAFSQ